MNVNNCNLILSIILLNKKVWFVEYTFLHKLHCKLKLASAIYKAGKAHVDPSCPDCWKHRQTQKVTSPYLLGPDRTDIWPAVIFLLLVANFLLKKITNSQNDNGLAT